MSAKRNYRYRLWGINWFPLVSLSLATMGLWAFLKYYDSSRPEDLQHLYWKLALQVCAWFLLTVTLVRGWFKARYAFYAAWGGIVLIEVGQSVYLHDGFRFVLGLIWGVLFYTTYQWIENCLDSASVNPRLKWFEGKLGAIPNLKATVQQGENNPVEVKVRTMDESGAFVLFPDAFAKKSNLKVKLKYKAGEVELRAKPVAELLWEERGLGLQFFFEDLYHQNQYTNLVQQIKGEGLA